MVRAMTEPVALVLDHVEALQNRACLDTVAERALGLSAGSQVALAARCLLAMRRIVEAHPNRVMPQGRTGARVRPVVRCGPPTGRPRSRGGIGT